MKKLITEKAKLIIGEMTKDLSRLVVMSTVITLVTAIVVTHYMEAQKPAEPEIPPVLTHNKVIKPAIRINQKSKGKLDPRVRLHDKEGKFFCSGTVISKNYVLTAAHCITTDSYTLEEKDIMVVGMGKTGKGSGVSIPSKAAAANNRMDTGLLMGDFSLFEFAQIEIDPTKIIFNTKGPFVTCGFPLGGKLFCPPVQLTGISNFMLEGNGVLQPGMSGGGLYSENTGKIIGVNSQIIPERPFGVRFAIINDIFDSLDIEMEE